ncbi:hypothetical protein PG994_002002 [Apiospora phragmitis]|uniref:Uncharacterized protein n=1 Tax=Apiospora phragmitis TaxID=2905665 RepID=A0ABR1WV85_9PEZI
MDGNLVLGRFMQQEISGGAEDGGILVLEWTVSYHLETGDPQSKLRGSSITYSTYLMLLT